MHRLIVVGVDVVCREEMPPNLEVLLRNCHGGIDLPGAGPVCTVLGHQATPPGDADVHREDLSLGAAKLLQEGVLPLAVDVITAQYIRRRVHAGEVLDRGYSVAIDVEAEAPRHDAHLELPCCGHSNEKHGWGKEQGPHASHTATAATGFVRATHHEEHDDATEKHQGRGQQQAHAHDFGEGAALGPHIAELRRELLHGRVVPVHLGLVGESLPLHWRHLLFDLGADVRRASREDGIEAVDHRVACQLQLFALNGRGGGVVDGSV
mmetsp:Transcript_59923/g.128601  ORF Transcript_59923/g.128601 Transcript_59923/m.128601 type:complete len:265 (-) Transcript_59923:389-1183(-)